MVGSSVNSMLITYFVVLHFSRLNLTFPCRLYLLIEEGKEKKKKRLAINHWWAITEEGYMS